MSISKHLPDTFPVKEELAYISAWIRRCASTTESWQAKTWSVSSTQRGAVQQSVALGRHNWRFLVKSMITLDVSWKTQNKVWQIWQLVLNCSYLYHSSVPEREVSVPLCQRHNAMIFFQYKNQMFVEVRMTKGMLLEYANKASLLTVHWIVRNPCRTSSLRNRTHRFKEKNK